ncbi:MAG TPA: iron-sulfur cluster assembly scaffold protein, partial [Planctomycetota bacterium]|nr:iron-sulfur cluster assembly scaffold protein [Planctomycetota bacterium]
MPVPTRSFREHFETPGRIGRLPDAERSGAAENLVCGDWVRFHLHSDGVRILEASVQVRGCSATIACASMIAEALQGLELARARELDVAEMARACGAKPRDLSHAPTV